MMLINDVNTGVCFAISFKYEYKRGDMGTVITNCTTLSLYYE